MADVLLSEGEKTFIVNGVKVWSYSNLFLS